MPRKAADLLNEVLALPVEERARLARTLIDSLEVDDAHEASATEIEAAWRTEVEKREEEIERDPSVLVPAEEVFREAERRLDEIRTAQGLRRRSG
ncbi:MAG: addiction module protein [Gemmatimonadota bacterium]